MEIFMSKNPGTKIESENIKEEKYALNCFRSGIEA